MTIETTIKLVCTNCGKTEQYINELPSWPNGPKNWLRLEPDFKHSLWTNLDLPVGGNFCSLECVIAHSQKIIEQRSKPPKIYAEVVTQEW